MSAKKPQAEAGGTCPVLGCRRPQGATGLCAFHGPRQPRSQPLGSVQPQMKRIGLARVLTLSPAAYDRLLTHCTSQQSSSQAATRLLVEAMDAWGKRGREALPPILAGRILVSGMVWLRPGDYARLIALAGGPGAECPVAEALLEHHLLGGG